MGLTLTLLGKSAERWQVRVELEPDYHPAALTVALWSEADRPLGPAVIVTTGTNRCMVADLRGPQRLPPGTCIVATVDTVDGTTETFFQNVDPRRGLHAFLHADARISMESDPKGAPLTTREIINLGRRFPWLCGCSSAGQEPAEEAGEPSEANEDDDLVSMLKREFDLNEEDIPDDLRSRIRT